MHTQLNQPNQKMSVLGIFRRLISLCTALIVNKESAFFAVRSTEVSNGFQT
jgi:hypothetical protein